MAKLSEIDILKIGHTIQMAGAVYVGEGKVYLAMFPEDRGDIYSGEHKVLFGQAGDELPVDVLDMDQDDWAKLIRQTDLLETEALARAADGTIQKAVLRKSQRHIDQGVFWQVFKRDSYRCRYCGKDGVPLTVDHLVCWEDGGPSTAENLVASCRKCNKVRGNTPYWQWLSHAHYLKVSQNLDEDVRLANAKLIDTLDSIPRQVYKRSR